MMRQLISLVVCLLALSMIVNSALVDCVFNHINFYDTATTMTPFFDAPGDYFIVEYDIPTTLTFANQMVYFNISRPNALNSTVTWSVNGGPENGKTIPTDPTINGDRYLISGLTSGLHQCSVVNQVELWFSQIIRVNRRNESCSYRYLFKFTSTNPAVCGDPQFVGLRGQSFQVHGIDGAIYNLISTESYSVNSQFRFLSGPRPCPIMPTTGRKSLACWTHEGSYLENVAFVTSQGEKFVAQGGSASNGFSEVSFNGRKLVDGDSFTFSQGSVFVNSTHELTLNIGVFYIEVENVDGFVNLRRIRVGGESIKVLASGEGTHGLIGQTWQNKRYSGRLPEIEGAPDDYVIETDDIYGTNFLYSRMSTQ